MVELIQPDGTGGSGSTLSSETPTGAVNGSNTVYTVLHDPLFVIIDGMFKIAGQGYSYSSPTITTDAENPPVFFIQSFYNT